MAWRTYRSFGLLAPLSILLGCGSYSLALPKSPPIDAFGAGPSDAATVCVLRPSHWALRTTYVVHDDGQLVGATRGEGYFCYWAQPGPHRIVSSPNESADDPAVVTERFVAGHHYWLVQGYDDYFGTRLEWIEEERARQLVNKCDYQELVEAPMDEVIPYGVPIARALVEGSASE